MYDLDKLFYFQLVVLQDEVVCDDLPINLTVTVTVVHSIYFGHVVQIGTLDRFHVRYHDTASLTKVLHEANISLVFLIARITELLLCLVHLLCHFRKEVHCGIIEVVLNGKSLS